MAWSDIDFNIIKKGMITKGPASVSFGDYLNQFLKAAQERVKVLTGSIKEDLDLPGIDDWQAGYIRQKSNTNSNNKKEFPAQFRALIELYSYLWNLKTYYYRDVLDDLENYQDYIVEDHALEVAIGEEAWDIFLNYESLSFEKIFKASILHAFYTIYELTEVVEGSLLNTAEDPLESKITQIQGFGYRWYGAQGRGDSIAEAKEEIDDNAFYQAEAQVTGYSNRHSIQEFSSGFVTIDFKGELGNFAYGILQKDLNDDVIESDIYIVGELRVNQKVGSEDFGVLGPYDDDYPLLLFNQEPISIQVEPTTIISGATGTINQYIYRNNSAIGPEILPFELGSPPDGKNYVQANRIEHTSKRGFINLNLPDLEYYIN
jgi:hypothetical protein